MFRNKCSDVVHGLKCSDKNVQMLSVDDSEEEEKGFKPYGCGPHVHLLPRHCK